MRSRTVALWVTAFSAIFQFEFGHAASYLPVPWSTTYYGPDGPWQAITLQVGGIDSQATTQVDLIPSGAYGSMVLSENACTDYPSTPCGKGGFWTPTLTDSTDTNYRAAWVGNADQIAAYGEEYVQAMTINGKTVSNVALVSVDNATYTSPGGTKYGPELGTLALGAGGGIETQTFATATSANASTAFMFMAGLFNQSIIPSYSYGLHIVSASLDYGGSLVMGGYDKGRILGKYTNYSADTVTLLDIGFGVEKGGSPFSGGFKSKSGLLLNGTGAPTSMTVNPNPGIPALYLPGKTCEEIAKYLPVTYDTTLRYYLWNTDDPYYEKIVTSPAYMSFTFPPALGGGANVSIKVPFMLLNLTLDAPLVSTPTPYFPCIPFSGDVYRLGRAFLQAAFIGVNYRAATTWLGQAPGPGDSRNGLGIVRQNIADADTEIESSDDDGTTFADSWDSYWTPLAEDGTETATPSAVGSAAEHTTPSSNGLSTAAKAGISVGVVVFCMLVLGAVLFWRRRRRRASSGAAQASTSESQLMHTKCPFGCPVEAHHDFCPCKTPTAPIQLWTQSPLFLHGREISHELPGSGVYSPQELDNDLRTSHSQAKLEP